MTNLVPEPRPGLVIGVLGAGQLGRMLALAAYPLGVRCLFLDPAADACAAGLGAHLQAAYDDDDALARFCAGSDIATYEFENVPVAAAEFVAARVPLRPGPQALTASQDRLHEKTLLARLGIPVPAHAAVDDRPGLDQAVAQIGLPAVLKTRRMGYDGKGQFVLRTPADLDAAWAALGAQPLILEAFVRFEREVSCLAVRAMDGAMAFYPLVENQHQGGILQVSTPLAGDPLQPSAEAHARAVADALDYVGVLAFEFFVADGRLIANEIAPRVHNSGHWTTDGAETSQFENHLRAICGWPLGSTRLRGLSAMVNFVGAAPPPNALLALPGVRSHQYGKAPRPGRKIGHATVLADDTDSLRRRVAAVLALLPGSATAL